MNGTEAKMNPLQIHEGNVVTTLLPKLEAQTTLSARNVAMLKRRAPQIVRSAHKAGVPIEYLGVSPLFSEHRLYCGPTTDWTIGPVDEHEDIIVPRKQREALLSLREAGISFPLTYVAHEIPKSKTAELGLVEGGSPLTIDRTHAADLVGPVPPPAATVKTNEQLGRHAVQIVKGLVVGATAVGAAAGAAALAVVAAPVVLTAGAIAALGTLDPLIIGACPAVTARPGDEASWFLLASWEW